MPVIVRPVLRLSCGLLGLYWLFVGVFGVAYAGSDHAWRPVISAVITLMLGAGLAWCAFVRAPWEARAARRPT